MEHFEVWSMVEGALESSEEFDTLEDAEHAAMALAETYGLELAEVAWSIFLLPHYCGADGECVCASWLTDHHPLFSSVPA